MCCSRHLFWKGLVSLSFALIWIIASTLPVFADVAPPPRPMGAGIQPSDYQPQTQVRMMYENVFMDIDLNGGAKVDANFVMRNLGDKEEVMDVYFPLYLPDAAATYKYYSHCERRLSGESIADLAVWVWDQPTPVRTDFAANPNLEGYATPSPENPAKIPCWGVFAARFPPGLDVPIEVKYTSPSYGYILTTGAGWNGTIGQADITFRLPYDVIQDQNLDSCTPKCTINGRDIQWQFKDFEPVENIKISIASPRTWWQILTETNALKLNPKDGAAWKRLALDYDNAVYNYFRDGRPLGSVANLWRNNMAVETFKKAISLNPGDFDLQYLFTYRICNTIGGPGDAKYQSGQPKYQDNWMECIQQIKNTVALHPDDSDLHYHFASLVCQHAAWDFRYEDNQNDAWVAAWVECSQQLKQSLDINPQNNAALDLANIFAQSSGPFWKGKIIKMNRCNPWNSNGQCDPPEFLLLSPTPQPYAPSYTLTYTPDPKNTPIITLTPTYISTPVFTTTPTLTITPTPAVPISETGSNAVWAWIFVPLAGMVIIVMRRRRGR